MSTFSRVLLSGSTNGRPIKITTTSSPGDTIHTAVSSTSSWDEIWLWCVNTDTSPIKLTVQWGGTSSPDDSIEQTIPPESGLFLVSPGLNLNNSLVVKAFAATANLLTISGYANRIT